MRNIYSLPRTFTSHDSRGNVNKSPLMSTGHFCQIHRTGIRWQSQVLMSPSDEVSHPHTHHWTHECQAIDTCQSKWQGLVKLLIRDAPDTRGVQAHAHSARYPELGQSAQTLPTKMAAMEDGKPSEQTQFPRVGRPRKPLHEKRRRQQEATKWRDARRVYLGNSYDRWKKLKSRIGLKDCSLAWHLMEAHDSHCVECG